MPAIVISAILDDYGRILLTRRQDGAWDLPTGALADGESTEQALDRILRETLGLRVLEQQFLETYFERVPETGEPLLRNVYLVRSWQELADEPRAVASASLLWSTTEDSANLPLGDDVQRVLLDLERSRILWNTWEAGLLEEW